MPQRRRREENEEESGFADSAAGGGAPVWLRADGGADTCTDSGNGGREIGQ